MLAAMPRPVTLTDSTFMDTVLGSPVPVLVDFWAQWNSTCKALAPSIDVLAEEYDGRVLVAKLEVDANPVSPSMFAVASVPQLIIFSGGVASTRIPGYRPIEVLRRELDAALGVAAS
jgi:thioredoxin 1